MVFDQGTDGSEQGAELAVSYPRDGVCVIDVQCELDMLTSPALTRVLSDQLAAGCGVLVVDLGGCEFLGSSGLATLVTTRERIRDTSTSFALAGVNRITSRALRATGIEGLFDIYASSADAATALTRESDSQSS
jgi:anti-sigma B factor antagonist